MRRQREDYKWKAFKSIKDRRINSWLMKHRITVNYITLQLFHMNYKWLFFLLFSPGARETLLSHLFLSSLDSLKQFSRPSSTTKCSIILYLIFFNKCPNFQQFHSVAVYHACLVHLPYTRIRRYRIDIGIGRWSKLQDRYRTDDGRTDEKVVSNHQLSWWTIKLSLVYTVFTCWSPLMQKIQSS